MRRKAVPDIPASFPHVHSTPCDTARLVETLARAMYHAHQHGIIHGDLKPANILLCADGLQD